MQYFNILFCFRIVTITTNDVTANLKAVQVFKYVYSFIIIIKSNLCFYNNFCVTITFNNPLKVCFSNKQYPITTQTPQIVKVYFLFKIVF